MARAKVDDFLVASVTINGADVMTPQRRRSVAAWLNSQAKFLREAGKDDLSKRLALRLYSRPHLKSA